MLNPFDSSCSTAENLLTAIILIKNPIVKKILFDIFTILCSFRSNCQIQNSFFWELLSILSVFSLFSSLHSSHSILAEAKNLSFNATAAFHAYSNIKANIDAAEKEAKAAKQRASEALALVRVQELVHISRIHFLKND